MQPIMAVWAGYTLNGASIAESGLAPFIQTARDQIDFVIGNPATNAMGGYLIVIYEHLIDIDCSLKLLNVLPWVVMRLSHLISLR